MTSQSLSAKSDSMMSTKNKTKQQPQIGMMRAMTRQCIGWKDMCVRETSNSGKTFSKERNW